MIMWNNFNYECNHFDRRRKFQKHTFTQIKSYFCECNVQTNVSPRTHFVIFFAIICCHNCYCCCFLCMDFVYKGWIKYWNEERERERKETIASKSELRHYQSGSVLNSVIDKLSGIQMEGIDLICNESNYVCVCVCVFALFKNPFFIGNTASLSFNKSINRFETEKHWNYRFIISEF